MGYFSKETYERKREYAARVCADGLDRIATRLVTGFEDWNIYVDTLPDDDNYKNTVDEKSLEIESLTSELKPIADLSEIRHKAHSLDRTHYASNADDAIDIFKAIDNNYYSAYVVAAANEINEKYALVPYDAPALMMLDVDTETDSYEEILEYLGEPVSEDEEENKNNAYECLTSEYDRLLNEWSDSVREWFGYLNEKFGTDFPD